MAGTTYYTAASGSGSAGGNASQATGTYVGDGAENRLITTGLTGTLRYVTVEMSDVVGGAAQVIRHLDVFPGKWITDFSGASANNIVQGIAFIGANFTVDFTNPLGAAVLNDAGRPYSWVAVATP
jgi:hypothetical protein